MAIFALELAEMESRATAPHMRFLSRVSTLGFVALMTACAPEDGADPDTGTTDDELSTLQLSCSAGTQRFVVEPNSSGTLDGVLTVASGSLRFTCVEETVSDGGVDGGPTDAGRRKDGSVTSADGGPFDAQVGDATTGASDASTGKTDAGKSDAGSTGGTIVARCTERPQSTHAGSYSVIVREQSNGDVVAEFSLGDAGASASFACGTRSDAGPKDAGPEDDDAGPDDDDAGPGDDDAAVDAGPAPAGLTFDDASPIIQGKCNRCHTGAFDTLQDIRKWRQKMISSVSNGRMPRGDSSWKDSPDGMLLLEWLRNGQEFQSP